VTPLVSSAIVLAIWVAQPVPGTPYVLTSTTIGYRSLTAPITLLSSPTDDDEEDLTLPFAFDYYETPVSAVRVGTNGALLFDSTEQVGATNPVPGTGGSSNGYIAPFWDDLYVESGEPGTVSYQVEGSAPSRSITFEWRAIDVYPEVEPKMSFSVRLFEGGGGRIQIDYGPVNAMADVFLDGTMGMEDPNGGRVILFHPSGCTDECSLAELASLAGRRIDLVKDRGVDLVAVQITAPATALLGSGTTIGVRFRNAHGAAIPSVRFGIDLAGGGGEATRLYTSSPITLAPFETRDTAVEVTPPATLSPGERSFALTIDPEDVVAEVDEDNNLVLAGARTRLVPALADLSVVLASKSATIAASGDNIALVGRIANRGTVGATAAVALVLSDNPVITPQDLELARVPISLDPGQSTSIRILGRLPADLRSGLYWLGLFADPDRVVEETDESNGLAAPGAVTVRGRGLAVVTEALPRAIRGEPYAVRLEAIGGAPPLRWSLSAGVMPKGLAFDPTLGEIRGTALEPTSVELRVRVESGTESAERGLRLEVIAPDLPLTIVTNAIAPAVVGQEFAFQLSAVGGVGAHRWSASGLPADLALSPEGLLFGLPLSAGTATLALSVTDGAGTARAELTLVVLDRSGLAIDPTPLPHALFGAEYSVPLGARGGVPPLTWSLFSGALPSGLEIDSSGTISGTPTVVGRFRFVIEAHDSGEPPARDLAAQLLVVEDAPGFSIGARALPVGFVAERYEARIESTGGREPIRWALTEGDLPEGISLEPDGAAMRFFGEPDLAGTSAFLLEAYDADGRRARRALAITVHPARSVGGGCDCATERGPGDWIGSILFAILIFALVRRRGSH
jgi:hypothetical protein